MGLLGKIGRYLMIIFLVAFSALSIFLSLVERGIGKAHNHPFFSYASYFEDRFYDLRMNKTIDPRNKDHDIVLAALDDKALQKIARWPWTRTLWVDVLKKLGTFGAKVVAFDVVFPEPEVACGTTSPDELFSEAIKEFQSVKGRKVLLSYSLADPEEPFFPELPEDLYNYVINTQQIGEGGLQLKKISSSNFPVPLLLKGGPGLGFIGANSDVDGIFRHYPLLANIDTLYFPSLGLAAYQFFTEDNVLMEMQKESSNLKLKSGTLTLNYFAETKVRFLGGVDHFSTISMHDILKAPDNDVKMHKALKNKIVFIGSTAFGAHDLRHTPVDAQLPGVYFHMNLVHMLLKAHFFKEKEGSLKISLIILFIGVLMMLLMQKFANAIIDLATLILMIILSYLIDTYYFLPLGYEVKLFFCFFCFISCYSWDSFVNFYKTSQEKKQIKGTFSRYVAPAIVNEMLSNPDKLKVGGEKKNITVIFSDVRDFTSISEKLTAQQLSTCLNIYMGRMTDILFDTYGTLDKYIGDALVGYWGAPLDIPNHAYHGVRGALQMIEALPLINDKFREGGFPEFKIGIGLNTGECSVGNMGSEKIFSYTALGDNMNLGSRLEGLNKYYGTQILISEYTLQSVPENMRKEFTFREIDLVKVKGKESAVKIIEVLHSTHSFMLDKASLDLYHQAYHLFLEQDFDKAHKILSALSEKYPEDKSSLRLKKSCEEYQENPPDKNWDGVTTHKEK